jgi:hypothetical protein
MANGVFGGVPAGGPALPSRKPSATGSVNVLSIAMKHDLLVFDVFYGDVMRPRTLCVVEFLGVGVFQLCPSRCRYENIAGQQAAILEPVL